MIGVTMKAMNKYIWIVLILHVALQIVSAQNKYTLQYSSFFGGSHFEQARDLEIDKDGNIYIVGGTSSDDFPTTEGAFNQIYNNSGSATVGGWGPMMAFVAKFTPEGSLIWCTYIGGPNYDRAYAVEVDDDGFVYIGGRAGADFPTTEEAFQKTFTQKGAKNNLYGHQNGFVAKLSPDGSQLVWSTYYGSDSFGFFRDIAIDDKNNVYGILNAVNVKPQGIPDDAFDATHNGSYDMVAVKFSTDGSTIEWATFLGGAGEDRGGPSIKVGPDYSVYVAGNTQSSDFPTTENAIQKNLRGASDIFVTRIAPDGKSLIYSTYFGGNGNEFTETHGLFVDSKGQSYIACATTSDDIVATDGAFQSQSNGSMEVLIFKLNLDGSLQACSYVGGSGNDYPEGLYADAEENLYFGGGSDSDDFPMSTNAFATTKKGKADGFVTKVSPDFSSVMYSTYIGGNNDESVRAFDATDNGTIAISGQTSSTDFPTTSTSFQQSHASANKYADVFISTFSLDTPSSVGDSDNLQEITVYPNPAYNVFFIQSEYPIFSVKIYDLLGRLINVQQPLLSSSVSIADLEFGQYIIQIETEKSILSKVILKM
jgi:hypothetical protein